MTARGAEAESAGASFASLPARINNSSVSKTVGREGSQWSAIEQFLNELNARLFRLIYTRAARCSRQRQREDRAETRLGVRPSLFVRDSAY
jgi:hypothetical protein